MKPRKRDFERDNKLKLAYKDMGFYSNNPGNGKLAGKPMGDFIGVVPLDEEGRWDLNLLFSLFLSKPIHSSDYRYNEVTKKIEKIDYPPLIEELEKRGYDPKTIYFEIEKQGPNYTHDGIPDHNYSCGDIRTTLFEEFERFLDVFNIIRRKIISRKKSLNFYEDCKDDYHLVFNEKEFAYLEGKLGL